MRSKGGIVWRSCYESEEPLAVTEILAEHTAGARMSKYLHEVYVHDDDV